MAHTLQFTLVGRFRILVDAFDKCAMTLLEGHTLHFIFDLFGISTFRDFLTLTQCFMY
ncbi:hypothetical protein M514_27410, partial [Trichuris suis]